MVPMFDIIGFLFVLCTDPKVTSMEPGMIFFLTIFYTMVIGFFGLAAYDLLSRLSR